MAEAMAGTTLYDQVGGAPFFEQLVDAFYDGVADDAVLLRLYPEGADTAGARERLRLFLIQYWGGPTTYSDERGHPRLRMRHMRAAIDTVAPDDDVRATLLGYFEPAAEHMRNDTGLPISSPRR